MQKRANIELVKTYHHGIIVIRYKIMINGTYPWQAYTPPICTDCEGGDGVPYINCSLVHQVCRGIATPFLAICPNSYPGSFTKKYSTGKLNQHVPSHIITIGAAPLITVTSTSSSKVIHHCLLQTLLSQTEVFNFR